MMNEANLEKWMDLNSSPFMRAFAYRVLAKQKFKQGMWSKAIEYSQAALLLYPYNNNYRNVAEREYLKYMFAPLVLEVSFSSIVPIRIYNEKDQRLMKWVF